MRIASALSQHVESGQAVVQILEAIHRELDGASPDLLMLFPSEHHASRLEAIARSLRDTWPRAALLGCGATSVIGGGLEVEEGPAIALLAARLPEVEVRAFRLDGSALGSPEALRERVCAAGSAPTAVLLLADPFSPGTEAVLAGLDHALPGTPVLGGVASGSSAPGRTGLLAQDEIARHGWVGATLHGAIAVETVVAQGCRPIGTPMFVTRSEGQLIHELDGRPPMEIVQELFEQGDAREQALMQSALFVGLQMHEGRSEYGQGDFLIRNLIGADEDTGAIAVGAELEDTLIVQLHVRDAHAADEDLELALRARTRRHLGSVPIAGFFGNGEIGPIEDRTHLHAYTSVFGLLCEREDTPT